MLYVENNKSCFINKYIFYFLFYYLKKLNII